MDSIFEAHPRLFVLLVAFAVAGIAAAVLDQHAWLWVLCICGVACGLMRQSLIVGFVMFALPALAYGYGQWRLSVFERVDISNLSACPQVSFSGRVLSIAVEADKSRLEVSVEHVLFPPGNQYQGVVLVQARTQGNLFAGEQVAVSGRLEKPKTAAHPWQFDYAAYLRRKGILSIMRCRPNALTVLPADQRAGDWAAAVVDQYYACGFAIDHLRQGIIATHRRTLGTDLGDLLSSIVIGNRAVKPPAKLVDDFRNVGLSHLLAASGFNLTIAAGALFFVASKLCHNDLVINTLSLSGIAAFVALAGPSPSVTRAAMMCTLAIVARILYRSPHTMAIISAALLVTTILDPLAVTDVGLQLSYCAAAGIVLLSGTLTDALRFLRIPKVLAECVAVILSAQISVLPVLLYYFWQVGTMFLLTNLLVAPVVAPITVVGFLSSLTACFEPLHPCWAGASWLLDWLCRYPLQFLILVAQYFAANQAARMVCGPPLNLAVLCYYSALLLAVLAIRLRRHTLLALSAYAAAACFLFWRVPLPPHTVSHFRGCTVDLSADRRAVVQGRLSAAVVRYLTYHGVDVKKDVRVQPEQQQEKQQPEQQPEQ